MPHQLELCPQNVLNLRGRMIKYMGTNYIYKNKMMLETMFSKRKVSIHRQRQIPRVRVVWYIVGWVPPQTEQGGHNLISIFNHSYSVIRLLCSSEAMVSTWVTCVKRHCERDKKLHLRKRLAPKALRSYGMNLT